MREFIKAVGDWLVWIAIIAPWSLLLFWAVDAFAQRKPQGLDIIALQKDDFPVAEVKERLPAEGGFVGSHLDWTFGTHIHHLKTLLDTGKVQEWEIDFFNGPGLRNGQLGAYEPHHGHTVKSFNSLWERGGGELRKHLGTRVKLYCNFFGNYPAVALKMSPTLEHNLTEKAFNNQARVIQRNCPRAVIVDNPVKGVRHVRGYIEERHGATSGVRAPCLVSLDGERATDINFPKFIADHQHCDTIASWDLPLNCRLGKGDFVDPRKRKHCPTPEQLDVLFAQIAKDIPGPPAMLPGACEKVERPRLWKVWADDHGGSDVRANKPLWLTPWRGGEVVVYSAVGNRRIGSLKYYGPFDGGGYRYYSGTGDNLYPMQFANRAEVLTGSPYVVVREGSGPDAKCFGPFLPYYRQGYYR